MYLLGLGIVLLIMKYFAIGPVAAWSWWLVFAPFALTVVWWTWADKSGYTRRKSMEREEKRVQACRDRTKDQLNAPKRPGQR